MLQLAEIPHRFVVILLTQKAWHFHSDPLIKQLIMVSLLFRSHVLQKVCMYFTYKVRYTNSSTEIPEFPIAPEIALELLMAANFLDC